MGFWPFGKKKEDEEVANKAHSAPTDLPTAIMKNKEAIETLEKRQLHLERRCENLMEEAKKRIKNKDQEGAKLALRRKKMLEAELTQLGNARLTLEQQINTLESQQTQQVAVIALSQGIHAQKQLTESLNISSIDKLMEDLQEQQDRQQEVAQVLSQGIPLLEEDELTLELNMLQEDELVKQLDQVKDVPTAAIGTDALPQDAKVTTTTPLATAPASSSRVQLPQGPSQRQTPAKCDEEELKRLEAELAS